MSYARTAGPASSAVKDHACARRASLGGALDDEEFGLDASAARDGAAAAPAQIPMDVQLQLTLAATNTLFRLLHSIPELARTVWDVGGPPLVHRVVALASRLRESFEEAGTKLLVVFFSHRHIQDAVREAGARVAADARALAPASPSRCCLRASHHLQLPAGV